MEDSVPFSSVFGGVSRVQKDSKKSGFIRVTIFGEELLLQRGANNGIEELGLLRLTRRNERIFLIYHLDKANGTHQIVAGWNNPDIRTVRIVQSLIVNNVDIEKGITPLKPTWTVWDKVLCYVV